MRVVWTSVALERAQAIRELIVSTLDRFPRRGRMVPEFGDPAVREIQHQPYRIIYEIRGDVVAILTIRHGRQIFD
jgi:toxin ParE1/3/4